MNTTSHDKIAEIKNRCDLVDLVGEYLRLEKKGKNYAALCPFHQEKTPSFTVSPEKQLYYCFGCGEGGDHFKFVMSMEKLSFSEALNFLARKAGVSLPEAKSSTVKTEGAREKIIKLNHLAWSYYRYMLNSSREGEKARQYLKERGITPSSLDRFGLGYAPARWDGFLQTARKKGCPEELLLQAGLIVARGDEKGYYDRFRHRIIFPIYDINGRVVAFGGRAMEENPKTPKYLNSPQTPVYDKGHHLYGIYQARPAIRKEERALIMEGYTDVISAHQEGLENAVASLGTALTPMQARLLRNQTKEVVIAYDADEGGKSATLRGMVVLNSSGLRVRVAEIPPGYDPDSYLREKGLENFQRLVEEADYLMDYQMKRLRRKHDLATAEGKRRYLEEYLPMLEGAGGLEKEHYIKLVAEEMSVSEAVLREELKRYNKRKRNQEKNSNNLKINGKNNIIRGNSLDSSQELLLYLLLHHQGALEKVLSEDDPELFSPEMQKIIDKCKYLKDRGEHVHTGALINIINEESISQTITRLSFKYKGQEYSEEEVYRMADDCIRNLKRVRIVQQRNELEAELKKAERGGDNLKVKALLQKIQHLNAAERKLHGGAKKEGKRTW